MLVLWLDDVRPPWKHGFVGAEWVKTAEAAITELATGKYDYASLDHDLSEMATIGMAPAGEKTGYDVVCWLEQNPQFWPSRGVRVHSMNPSGAERMRAVISAHYSS